jgi:hypothetical protein
MTTLKLLIKITSIRLYILMIRMSLIKRLWVRLNLIDMDHTLFTRLITNQKISK